VQAEGNVFAILRYTIDDKSRNRRQNQQSK